MEEIKKSKKTKKLFIISPQILIRTEKYERTNWYKRLRCVCYAGKVKL